MNALVVEDNPHLAPDICRALEGAEFAVSYAATGKTALEAIDRAEFDLIVLDLVLPDADGIDLCIEMRRMGVNAVIVMLTSRVFIEDRVLGLDSGADDYITKPFAFDELLARIRALFRRERVVQYTKLRHGDLELDPKTCTVYHAGVIVPLTSREYRVLNFLLRHTDQICTKTMLEEHVWGHYDTTHSNVIEVTVSRVRRKLNEMGKTDLIKNRRGLGYIIESDPDDSLPSPSLDS